MSKHAYTIIVSEYFKSRGKLLDLELPSHRAVYKRNLRAAKDLLECAGGDLEDAVAKLHRVARWAKSLNLSYSLETVVKRYLEDNTPQQRPYVILNGKRYECRERNGDWYVLENGKWYHYSGRKSDVKYD